MNPLNVGVAVGTEVGDEVGVEVGVEVGDATHAEIEFEPGGLVVPGGHSPLQLRSKTLPMYDEPKLIGMILYPGLQQ